MRKLDNRKENVMDKINLQLFAEDEPTTNEEKSDNEQTDIVQESTESESEVSEKTYTQEEVEKMVQSETDRRVNQALDKKMVEFKETLEEEKKEAERLAKLSEAEKQKELELKREQDLEKRERELTRKTLELDAVKELSDRGLPSSFVDMVVADDAEQTFERIKSVETLFREEIQKAVDEKLKMNSPKQGQSSSSDNPWKKETLNVTKQMLLLRSDPEKAKQLKAEAGVKK